MGVPIGKEVRQSYFLPDDEAFALLVDLSRCGSVGAVSGLEELRPVLERLSPLCHGIVLNPGAMEKNADLLGGRHLAAGLVRADWTNALRPDDFVLPVQRVHRRLISDPDDALGLGAAGIVATLLMGYDDQFEAKNIEEVSHLARECYRRSLPIVVEVLPIGPKVTSVNHDGVVKLAVSFMMEAGADALVVPSISDEERGLLGSWPTVPVLERRDELPRVDELASLKEKGYRGVLVGEATVAETAWERKLSELSTWCREGEVVSA